MSSEFDYYEVLGITRDCNNNEIKKAYKKMAMKYHPDKNPENQEAATEMFKKIAEAYDTLNDTTKRRDYDSGREVPYTGMSSYESMGRNAPARSSSRSYAQPSHHFSRDRAFDIFNHFFAEMDEFHHGFMNDMNHQAANLHDPFAIHQANLARHQAHMAHHDSYHRAVSGHHDPFMSGFGSFGSNMAGHHSSSSSSFGGSSSSSSISYGSGMAGKSTSSSTYISADGTKRTRIETTIIHPDGRKDTTVEEKVHEPQRRQVGNGSDSTALRINRNGGSSSSVQPRW